MAKFNPTITAYLVPYITEGYAVNMAQGQERIYQAEHECHGITNLFYFYK